MHFRNNLNQTVQSILQTGDPLEARHWSQPHGIIYRTDI